MKKECVINVNTYYKTLENSVFHEQTDVRIIEVLRHLDKSILDMYKKNLDETESDEKLLEITDETANFFPY